MRHDVQDVLRMCSLADRRKAGKANELLLAIRYDYSMDSFCESEGPQGTATKTSAIPLHQDLRLRRGQLDLLHRRICWPVLGLVLASR